MGEVSIYYDCHQKTPGPSEQMCSISMGKEQGWVPAVEAVKDAVLILLPVK